jgi:hypothetical protein
MRDTCRPTKIKMRIAVRPQRRYGPGSPVFEAIVAGSIILVGMVYSAVLRALWKPTGAKKWVDARLHDLAPVLFLVFWLRRPHGSLRCRQMPWLLIGRCFIVSMR